LELAGQYRNDNSLLKQAKKYLRMRDRFKQVALISLYHSNSSEKWDVLDKSLLSLARSENHVTRLAVIPLIPTMADYDTNKMISLVELLAVDPIDEVRERLACMLIELSPKHCKWFEIIRDLAENENWRARCVAAMSVGLYLNNRKFKLVTLAKKLSMDSHPKVTKMLIETMLANLGEFDESWTTKIMHILKTAILNSSYQELSALSLVYYQYTVVRKIQNTILENKELNIRIFIASIWHSDVEDDSLRIATSLAFDPSVNVRRVFARRLARMHTWTSSEKEKRIFKVVEKLSEDSDLSVRSLSYFSIWAHANLKAKRDEYLYLLNKCLKKEKNRQYKCSVQTMIDSLKEYKDGSFRYGIFIYIYNPRKCLWTKVPAFGVIWGISRCHSRYSLCINADFMI